MCKFEEIFDFNEFVMYYFVIVEFFFGFMM